MHVFHLIALICAAIATLCALLAVTGVNKGWLHDDFTDCGTIKCCSKRGPSNCVSLERLFSTVNDCNLDSGGKATLAICVINFVFSLAATIIIVLRFLGILQSKGLSILCAVWFIVSMILCIVAIGIYVGVYLGSCCPGSCSADGGYALVFDTIGIPFAIATFVVLFIRPAEGAK